MGGRKVMGVGGDQSGAGEIRNGSFGGRVTLCVF